MNQPVFYVALAFAGGAGAVTRYWMVQASVKVGWTQLPFGTLFVNVAGSFLIGFLSLWMLHKTSLCEHAQLLVLTGCLGGFTTFSAFSIEVVKMLESAQFERAFTYVTASLSLSILFCFAGFILAKRLI